MPNNKCKRDLEDAVRAGEGVLRAPVLELLPLRLLLLARELAEVLLSKVCTVQMVKLLFLITVTEE